MRYSCLYPEWRIESPSGLASMCGTVQPTGSEFRFSDCCGCNFAESTNGGERRASRAPPTGSAATYLHPATAKKTALALTKTSAICSQGAVETPWRLWSVCLGEIVGFQPSSSCPNYSLQATQLRRGPRLVEIVNSGPRLVALVHAEQAFTLQAGASRAPPSVLQSGVSIDAQLQYVAGDQNKHRGEEPARTSHWRFFFEDNTNPAWIQTTRLRAKVPNSINKCFACRTDGQCSCLLGQCGTYSEPALKKPRAVWRLMQRWTVTSALTESSGHGETEFPASFVHDGCIQDSETAGIGASFPNEVWKFRGVSGHGCCPAEPFVALLL